MSYETIAEMYQAWYEGIRKAPVWREEEYKHARRQGLEQGKAYMALFVPACAGCTAAIFAFWRRCGDHFSVGR